MNLPKKIFLVIHDWGSALGFHWANQHRDRLAGIAFMEAVVEVFPDYDFLPEDIRPAFKVFSLIKLIITTVKVAGKSYNRVLTGYFIT